RRFGSFEVFSPWAPVGTPTSVSADAARLAFEEAGLGPSDIDVCQLQDTESGAEVMHLAECGFCEHGEQERLIPEGATAPGGALPVNTDGGCIANGEPIGASGLRQVHEIVQQLRGRAGERQLPDRPSTGFTHVYGAPGVSACTVLTR
ncbi:thiolase family protein, partial [Streptomyces sp. NPDC057927]